MDVIIELDTDTQQTLDERSADAQVNDALRLWNRLENPEEVLDAHAEESDE